MYGISGYIDPFDGGYDVLVGAGESKTSRRGSKPKLRKLQHHAELKPNEDTPALSVADGVVLDVGEGESPTVLLGLPDGTAVQYSNLAASLVEVGDALVAGQPLGEVKAGDSLHFSVVKDGESVAEDGTKFARAPRALRARLEQINKSPLDEEGVDMKDEDLEVAGTTGAERESPETITILKGTGGYVVPDSERENELYEAVADMELEGAKESAYAEVAKAVAAARDSIESRPMLQSSNPIRAEILKIFDLIEV